jgi:hypothetical protein
VAAEVDTLLVACCICIWSLSIQSSSRISPDIGNVPSNIKIQRTDPESIRERQELASAADLERSKDPPIASMISRSWGK